MGQCSNHYEAAFEDYLRMQRRVHVTVDESRRAVLEEVSLKSMDFIVYSPRTNLLVDVKGRRFPSGDPRHGHKWENWATEDDIDSLKQWEEVFGPDFRALLVFAYHVVSPDVLDEFENVYKHGESLYAFFGVWVDDYQTAMTVRSPSWETVGLRGGMFRELRKPIDHFL